MVKPIFAGLFAILILFPSITQAREKGENYTIRDKNYRVDGYYRNGKIYDKDYKIQGYVTGDKIRDKDYRVKGYLEKDNRGNPKPYGGEK